MFILLTDTKGVDIMINVKHITCARRVGGRTEVFDRGGDFITVEEHPREIYDMIQAAGKA